MHFTSVSCVQCYLSDDMTKTHNKRPQLQRTTRYCRKCIAIFSWECSDYNPFPNPSMLPEGLLCLRGVLCQSRKLTLLETSSLPLLAFINPKLIKKFSRVSLRQRTERGVSLRAKGEKQRGTPHQPGSKLRCWVLGETGTCRVSGTNLSLRKDSEPHVWSQNSEPLCCITVIATQGIWETLSSPQISNTSVSDS